jgi:predicted amidohydrolase
MIAAIFQNNPIFGAIENNISDLLGAIKSKDFDLLVLPELFATGYQFLDKTEALSLADELEHGYTFEAMKQLSHEKNALIIYGFPQRVGNEVFNSALAIAPNEKNHLYQKMHLFDTEKNIFSPGKTGFSVFQYRDAKIGIMICFDWRFPEAARKLALLGGQIICHPSNLVMPHCPDAMITRALENCVYTATANRVGEEYRTGSRLKFIGKSRIIAPNGEVLAELGTEKGFVAVVVDPKLADNKEVTSRNGVFDDRRPEFY